MLKKETLEQKKNQPKEIIFHSGMIHLGDTVSVKTEWAGWQSGKVVCIAHNRRWFTLEFTFPSPWGSRTIRESFRMIPIKMVVPSEIGYIEANFGKYITPAREEALGADSPNAA